MHTKNIIVFIDNFVHSNAYDAKIGMIAQSTNDYYQSTFLFHYLEMIAHCEACLSL